MSNNGVAQNSNSTTRSKDPLTDNGIAAVHLAPDVTNQLNTIIQLMQAQTENGQRSTERMHQLMQGSLMVVAVLAAGATYQAGLSPPGGLWQEDDDKGHAAGMPILGDTFLRRYKAFFYCNSVAFTTSLVLIILLMNKEFYRHPKMLKVLHITMVLDLFGFMGAYAAGSCRDLTASIVLFLLMGGVFLQVIVCATFYSGVKIHTPCTGSTTLSMERRV